MNGYNYNSGTGEFSGVETLAESPLEPGIHLVPASCTLIAPPDVVVGFTYCWNGEAWVQVEDHRGETGYINGVEFVISSLGAYPDGWSTTPPAPDPNAAIDAQIIALEATATPRRIREAALTEAGRAWLADLDAQIAVLRAQRG